MKNVNLQLILPHVRAVVIFLLISVLYFSPEIFERKTVLGGDSRGGAGQEITEYQQQTGEISRWTNSQFSGMPTYQMAPSYTSNNIIIQLKKLYKLYLPDPVSFVFILMIGFYILLIVFGARSNIAILGAIGYAFSSYFFIIIEAGHIWKVLTLAYIPPTIAGIVLTYQKRYLLGGVLTALFMTFQISSNHVQMTYYSMFIVGAYMLFVLVDNWKQHSLPDFFKATGMFCIATLIAIMINLPNLYHTWEYSKETIRGKSELTHDAANKTSNGLNRDYMVQWSYGIGESWTLLIPNTKGGATGYIGNNKAINKVEPLFRQTIAQQNHYWGNQPFTSGPVYAGAFFMTLFFMALFLLNSKLKWYLLGTFIITLFLSWGKNFMAFTNLFADYFPMYSKFRSVSSILVIAELIIPLLGSLMVIELIKNPSILKNKKKYIYISFALTGGVALLFALIPRVFFNFLSEIEAGNFLPQASQNPQIGAVIDALEKVRMNIFQSDAWRSVIIIGIGGILLWLYSKKQLKPNLFVGALIALCLIDLWSVDKRYLNASSFIPQQKAQNISSFFTKNSADVEILKDKDPNFRVFNTTGNAFNESNTSFYHKSIGGYHAAKLRRYQELIDHHLAKGHANVFDMLNTKYFIVANNNHIQAVSNPNALGNAWFVENIQWVDNADEEISALTNLSPATSAIIDKRFKPVLKDKQTTKDSISSILLTHYLPNELHYKATSTTGGLGIFSEIYYPHGWKATIDGKEVPIIRANYVLRGIYIPGGEHEIVMTFKPASIGITQIIAYCGMFLLLGLTVFYVFTLKRRNCKS
ncbi:YfhO family protein [Odoribacter lunatus]|uniref:YfhO family protein n=1 Tax=Odoribacter lunatus TaxID=2941335 RepID=UPI002041EC16|nr:YfhO family protein [Odoribacter lunatus]